MKKLLQIMLMSMLAVLILAACGGKNEQPADKEPAGNNSAETEQSAATAYPYTFTDATGKELTLDKAPEKAISLIPSNTETLFEIGSGDSVIAVTENDDYPEQVKDLDTVGDYTVNIEKVISLEPDAVFAHEMMLSASAEGIDQLRDAGIPVIVIPTAETFDETYETIGLFGEIMNKNDEAAKIVEEMKAKVEEVTKKTADVKEPKRVFIENSDAPDIYSPGAGTFPQQFLDMLNAENIVKEEGWVMISPETIVDENPDVIIVTYSYVPDITEKIKARDGFSNVNAVKEDRIVQVDENLTNRTGPRLADGLEAYAKAIYPELFSE